MHTPAARYLHEPRERGHLLGKDQVLGVAAADIEQLLLEAGVDVRLQRLFQHARTQLIPLRRRPVAAVLGQVEWLELVHERLVRTAAAQSSR